MANKVNKINPEVLDNIKKKSPLNLPNSPSQSGLSPNALKQAFTGFVVDSSKSSLAEQERIINEINAIFAKLFVGVYGELPLVSDFEENDKIILEDGSIYKLVGGIWVKSSYTKEELDIIKQNVETLIECEGTDRIDIDKNIIAINLLNSWKTENVDTHIANKNNPHNVTSEQLNVYEKEHIDSEINKFKDGTYVVDKADKSSKDSLGNIINLIYGTKQELINHNEDVNSHTDIRNLISAFNGAYVYRAKVTNTTDEVNADKTILTNKIVEVLNRQPIIGDVVVDNNDNEWYFNGSIWNNYGQFIIGLASADNDGLMTKEFYSKLLSLHTRDELNTILTNLTNTFNNYFTKQQVTDLFNSLKELYGIEESLINTISHNGRIPLSSFNGLYDYFILTYVSLDGSNNYNTASLIIRDNELILGSKFEFNAGLSKALLTYDSQGLLLNVTTSAVNDTLKVVGIKLKTINANEVMFDNTDTDLLSSEVQALGLELNAKKADRLELQVVNEVLLDKIDKVVKGETIVGTAEKAHALTNAEDIIVQRTFSRDNTAGKHNMILADNHKAVANLRNIYGYSKAVISNDDLLKGSYKVNDTLKNSIDYTDVLRPVLNEKVGQVTYDGSEEWTLLGGDKSYILTNSILFIATTGFPNAVVLSGSNTKNNYGITSYSDNTYNDFESIWAKGYAIRINKSRLAGYSDNWTVAEIVNAFKTYLTQNPLTVTYKLAVENPKSKVIVESDITQDETYYYVAKPSDMTIGIGSGLATINGISCTTTATHIMYALTNGSPLGKTLIYQLNSPRLCNITIDNAKPNKVISKSFDDSEELSYQLPQLPNEWGMVRLSDTLYDEIDFINKKYITRIGRKVNDGSGNPETDFILDDYIYYPLATELKTDFVFDNVYEVFADGFEEFRDSENNLTEVGTIISYKRDTVKQVEEDTARISTLENQLASALNRISTLENQLASALNRISALETLVGGS